MRRCRVSEDENTWLLHPRPAIAPAFTRRSLQLLGVRASIVGVAGSEYVSSPCVLDMLASGKTLDVISTVNDYSTNYTALADAAPDVVFCTPGYCPSTPVDVAFPDSFETTLLGIADMGE